jgi:SAM-dependent methyltransferase
MSIHSPEELQRIYGARFSEQFEYRRQVWSVLVKDWFSRFIRPDDVVLDLGCGYGEFINAVRCAEKYAMDLNPDVPKFLAPDIKFFLQDCSTPWKLPDGSLDVVFTSNFLEHLPDKAALAWTFDEIHRCLRQGGRLIAMGPNIKYLPGKYWDFWDHHIALTEASLKEALVTHAFDVVACLPKFLPYRMATGPRYPLIFFRAYLKVPLVWKVFGKQFLVIAVRR